ncbi:unnamed protein product [Phytophthora lilii]|uniref:Unnamed protein product n=1 Tax=Phytophthora lilii TaxID=2077276 RepID=A0A9W6XI07_9STRA|nr:unnamed protein product [Phytophthora lilii]
MDVDAGPADEGPWVLRFDGACRRNPGPGCAGAALFAPSGAVVWTCSHYMPSSTETNNTAEYTALQLGVQSAVHHVATRLDIEGDSSLVIAQVKGTFACRNARLRQLRNRVRHALRSVAKYKLRHIDRKANAHADHLANRALDRRSSSSECGPHGSSMEQCCGAPTPTPAHGPTPPAAAAPSPSDDAAQEEAAGDDDAAAEAMDVEAEIAARDAGEAFPVLPIGPGSAPARQPRLRLRQLSDEERDEAADALQELADVMASKIADADSWATGEGYISAIPERIREVLQPYAT